MAVMEKMLRLKLAVHRQCLELLEERILSVRSSIDEMRTSARESSKSSAGDKHETGRAMTDLEIEKQQVSLRHLQQMLTCISQLDPQKIMTKAAPGALFSTSQGLIYIAVPLGRLKVENAGVLVISPEAPIVPAFGKYPHEKTIIFNGRSYEILDLV